MSEVQVDFSTLTPLEYLCLADRERIHTETLRWVLSEDSSLPPSAQLRILKELAGEGIDGYSIANVATEVKHIDLLVELSRADGKAAVALENKLKSAEHSSQLARYDESLAHYDPCFRLFLTLVGEQPASSDAWQPITYKTLHDALRVELGNQRTSSSYLEEYCLLLERLVAAVHLVTERPNQYAGHGAVFPAAIGQKPPEDFRAYVEKLRLRMILQRTWMHQLGVTVVASADVENLEWEIGETRGVALIDFVLARATLDNDLFKVGIQLQGRRFKVFAAPEPYPAEATDSQHAGVQMILNAVRKEMKSDRRITTSRKRGFRSFAAKPESGAQTLEIGAWAKDVAKLVRAVRSALERLVKSGSVTLDPRTT